MGSAALRNPSCITSAGGRRSKTRRVQKHFPHTPGSAALVRKSSKVQVLCKVENASQQAGMLPRATQLLCTMLGTHFILLKINAQVKLIISQLVIEIWTEVL